jgi:hypothetical protein
MKTDPNTSVFPHNGSFAQGLTKRELFAAMAMQGLLASPCPSGAEQVNAVICADKLIEELNKDEE